MAGSYKSPMRAELTAHWKGFEYITLAQDEDGVLVPMYGPAAILSHDQVCSLIQRLELFTAGYTPKRINTINQDEFDFHHGEGKYANRGRVNKPAKTQDGFIYILKVEGSYHKVGKTINLERRLVQYKNLPWTVHLVASVHVDDIDEAEARIHKLFADVRVKGEWFALAPEHIELFRSFVE